MRVLMISIDRGLLGQGQLGDVLERHAEYGKHVKRLDIIVFSPTGFNENQISENVKSFATNSKNKLHYFFDAKKLGIKLSSQNHYDLVVTQDPFVTGLVGASLKKLFGAKLLVHFHGDFWRNPNWLKENKLNWLFWLISQWVVAKADAIRVMSAGQKGKLGKYQNESRVISTPVNIEKYDNPNLEQVAIFKKLSEYPKILHVGRFDEVKDYDTLYRTFNIVYENLEGRVHFWQVGANLSLEQLRKKFPKATLSITGNAAFRLDPKVEPNSLINIYHSVDIVVLSSRSESFGKVLVEANACGKPVVSTATTGAKEIIQDGYNGFLAPIGDATALAEKIIDLLENPAKAREMGENGRKLVKEKFGDNTQKIIQFWREITNNNL